MPNRHATNYKSKIDEMTTLDQARIQKMRSDATLEFPDYNLPQDALRMITNE